MTGENLKEGLEGLSKIDGFTDFLFNAIYWIAVCFIIFFVIYICASVTCMVNRHRKGIRRSDDDDYLDD